MAVAFLAAGCGGANIADTTSTRHAKAGTTSRCTAASGGFRACTVFAESAAAFRRLGGGEVSRIERRRGSRWSVLLAPERGPHPRHGWWRRVLAGPGGRTLLAEWSGECEIPSTYLVGTHDLSLRPVFGSQPATALGWTDAGLARVKLWKPVYATKTRIRFQAGVYLVTRAGRVARLERRVPRSLGC